MSAVLAWVLEWVLEALELVPELVALEKVPAFVAPGLEWFRHRHIPAKWPQLPAPPAQHSVGEFLPCSLAGGRAKTKKKGTECTRV